MSAPLRLTAEDLASACKALERLTDMTARTGVRVAVYGSTDISVSGVVLAVSFDEATGQYVINDRIGS